MIAAYLKVESNEAGIVKGPVQDNRDENKRGSIALLAVEHNIVSPRDVATGMATGKRQHHPIVFTKETDNTTPLFYQFISRNEVLKTVDIFFYGLTGKSGLSAGREAMLYKITLKQAFVSKLELAGSTDATAQENARFPLTEKISLVYDSIQWEWTSPNASAADTFNSAKT